MAVHLVVFQIYHSTSISTGAFSVYHHSRLLTVTIFYSEETPTAIFSPTQLPFTSSTGHRLGCVLILVGFVKKLKHPYIWQDTEHLPI